MPKTKQSRYQAKTRIPVIVPLPLQKRLRQHFPHHLNDGGLSGITGATITAVLRELLDESKRE